MTNNYIDEYYFIQILNTLLYKRSVCVFLSSSKKRDQSKIFIGTLLLDFNLLYRKTFY